MEAASALNMRTRDIIVVGASAGGVEALCEFVSTLPEGFPASIFVVVHFPEHGTSTLPRILSRAGRLPAVHAADGDVVAPGRIYLRVPGASEPRARQHQERFAHTVEATEQRASTIRGVLLQRHGMLVHPVQTDAAPDGGPEG